MTDEKLAARARAPHGSPARMGARSVCPCVEAAGEAAGVDREAIEMLRWLTSVAEEEPKS